ncbi:hypothetical protein BT96DRAFT_784426, partial [Gymnopus androsaceus JB14]
ATRRPKSGCSITHNELRPNVRAKDRIHAWSSPYANSKRSERSLILPPEVIEWGEKLAIAGLADSTKEAYGAGLLRFNQFCDMLDISEDQRMPANEHLIVGFLGYHMGKVSGSCAKNWLSALRAWHELKGAPWPADSRLIRFARAGARVSGAIHKRPIRNPISINHMLALFLALKFSIPFHCSIWAVACNAFWGCRRLGELTVKSIAAFNPTYHAIRSTHILFSRHPDNSPKAVSFHIPWTKTTKQVGATVTATAQTATLKLFCPFNAMQMHVRANARIPDDFSLFAYVDDHGQPHHMVKSVFLTFCEKIWSDKGFPLVQGHSFRIGGAVELLLAGVSPEVVAAVGGWTSLAFLIYWRRFEDILPVHILKAYDSSQISRLKTSIDDFQKTHKIPD